MAIVLDSASVGANGAAITTLSWTHVLAGSLSNGWLHVSVSWASAAAQTVSSVVWDSGGANTALIRKGGATVLAGALNLGADLWYLPAPASGSLTVQTTFSGAVTGASGSLSLSGVSGWNGASAETATSTNNDTPNLSITSAAGEYAVGAVLVSGSAAIVGGSGQSELYNHQLGIGGVAAGHKASSGSPEAMFWSGGGTVVGWAQVGGSLVAAAPTTGFQPTFPPDARTKIPPMRFPLVQGSTVIIPQVGWGPLIGGRRNRLIHPND